LAGHVEQVDPSEEQVSQVVEHMMQELLLLPKGFTWLSEHCRQVVLPKYLFSGQVKQTDTLLELHV
jgi:hypothetical protein